MTEKFNPSGNKTIGEIKAQLEALFKGGPSALAEEVFNNSNSESGEVDLTNAEKKVEKGYANNIASFRMSYSGIKKNLEQQFQSSQESVSK